jgi:hypothetical protein
MNKSGNRLTDMEFDEVSLVTRPANQLSKVVLFKSDEPISEDTVSDTAPEQTEEQSEEQTEDVAKGYGMKTKMKKKKKEMPDFIKEKMAEKDEMEKEDEEMEDEDDEMPMKKGKGKMKKDDNDEVEIPAEVYDYIETLEAANAELVDTVSKLAEQVDAIADEREEVLKSADPKLVAIVKGLEDRAAAAEAIAKSERDHRMTQEFVSKASALSHLPVKAEEFGAVLKNAAEVLTEEEFGAIWQVLSATNAQLSKSGIFTEVGKSSAFDNSGPMSVIEKAATALRSANPALTREQSIARAVEADSNLYKQYISERK